MISLLTTARKATASAAIAFLGPLAALFVSDTEITARLVVGCLLTGVIAGLGTYEASNTEPYEPRHSTPPEV